MKARKRSESVSTSRQLTIYTPNSDYEDYGYNEYTAIHYAFTMKAAAKHKLESPTEVVRDPRWVEAVGLCQFRTTSLHQRLEGELAEKPKSAERPARGTTRPKNQTVNNPKSKPATQLRPGPDNHPIPAIRKPMPIRRNRRQYRHEAEADSTESKTKTGHPMPMPAIRSRSRFKRIEDPDHAESGSGSGYGCPPT